MVPFVSEALLGAIKGSRAGRLWRGVYHGAENCISSAAFPYTWTKTQLNLIAGALLGGKGASNCSRAQMMHRK